MVRITEALVRKKAEHNECIIGTLEELSLHQEDVEKIEHLNNWCKEIQILYLQANLIPKIENLNKLKKLQYLNLAINNIERIENLSRCESLEKLDLTLNFIGDLESVSSLAQNHNLKQLFLTGNPCCDYTGYRDYVITKLPQLHELDSSEITRSERIKAKQSYTLIEAGVKEAQEQYRRFRELQKLRVQPQELDDDAFWKSTSENCPEIRIELARRAKRARSSSVPEPKPKKSLSLYRADGRPLNVNQAKLDFHLDDSHPEKLILDLAVYKYLDTELIDVDLQPVYVRVVIKEKVFQIVLPEEVRVGQSTCQRSQVTGHLVLTMPRAKCRPVTVQSSVGKVERAVEEVKGWDQDVENVNVPALEFAF